MKRIVISLTLILVFPGDGFAFSACFQPQRPICVNFPLTFERELSFKSCRQDVERFVKLTEDYNDCLRDEAEERMAEAAKIAKKVIDQFNCRAKGESFCPFY